jgi:hypothetical protein
MQIQYSAYVSCFRQVFDNKVRSRSHSKLVSVEMQIQYGAYVSFFKGKCLMTK